ncbi:redox-regulated ATPase YchF [Candidatus Bathyarchaeota archaeon]|nr:redox-regulated ATPase YchF [Candidatus Bathyarchaeota archaeon]
MLIRIGLVGKTNTGKTTFFNASTLMSAEVSTYPFTTKKPNIGRAYVQSICVCRELGVKDDPRNSLCIDGWRFIPVEVMDLPGLIKGAHKGRGLGTQFLGVIGQADALLHIVDASGSVDAEGRITKPGMGNPVADVYDVETEIILWFADIIKRSQKQIIKDIRDGGASPASALTRTLAGLKVKRIHVEHALELAGLAGKPFDSWGEEDTIEFARRVREISKPTIIVANKMDLAKAEENYQRLTEAFGDRIVIPASSEAELALRRAESQGLIKYVPGEEAFKVVEEGLLTKEQRWALSYVQSRVLSKWIRTGVQFALNMCAFKLLGMNVVYPVEDLSSLSDKEGKVLPDAFLTPPEATVKDLAAQIHTDLAKGLLYAVDARTGLRLPVEYRLRDRDIIHIVSAMRRS